MSRLLPARVLRAAALPLAVAAIVLGSPPVPAPTTFEGEVGVLVPDPTEAGSWDGTWFYTSRDARIALWMRTRDGKPQLKLEYQGMQAPEAFETDWDSKATYYLAGQPATFEIKMTRADANRIEATWRWEVQFEDSGRIETGTFSIYRAGDGRSLVFKFDRLERLVRRGGAERKYEFKPTFSFRKMSKRTDVLWDELPV